MGNLTSTHKKHITIDGTVTSSAGEKIMYELLIDLYKRTKTIFKYQPPKIIMSESFTSTSGKKYRTKYYEPDFMLEHVVSIDAENHPVFQNIYVEVKGDNDKVFAFRKGQKPSVIDKGAEYKLKHRMIDQQISAQGDIFIVVRLSNLKTKEYAGMFLDSDWTQLKKYKTQGRKDLCAKVPRIETRLEEMLQRRLV